MKRELQDKDTEKEPKVDVTYIKDGDKINEYERKVSGTPKQLREVEAELMKSKAKPETDTDSRDIEEMISSLSEDKLLALQSNPKYRENLRLINSTDPLDKKLGYKRQKMIIEGLGGETKSKIRRFYDSL
jgi:hypothetical protein